MVGSGSTAVVALEIQTQKRRYFVGAFRSVDQQSHRLGAVVRSKEDIDLAANRFPSQCIVLAADQLRKKSRTARALDHRPACVNSSKNSGRRTLFHVAASVTR